MLNDESMTWFRLRERRSSLHTRSKSLLENSGGGWVSIGALAARRRVMTMIMAW